MAQNIIDQISKELPGKDKYFKRKQKEALSNGYLTIDPVTGRKFFFEGHYRLQELKDWMDSFQDFWKIYREEKSKNSEKFKKELKPYVKEYFVTKGNIERDAMNYPIQGCGASMTKYATVLIRDQLKKDGLWGKRARIVMLLHDEIVVECDEDLAEYIRDLTKEKMEESGRTFCKKVDMLAEPVITEHWTH